jgi:hypothetical protein
MKRAAAVIGVFGLLVLATILGIRSVDAEDGGMVIGGPLGGCLMPRRQGGR